ncbi:serine/threonine-protein kinase [Lentisphaera profundi]|uniref:Serine/threonine-protein kinase n=1 Tax=Lentisphaera profundi TaxID=1658616 RepID=A0ABY7VNZ3_9BACT|nr:serine/threonine-protein kinase [Lentisphaera profundi]WDE95392.1 serine/threonine-protein kinase [Lentisphaera profundi]
MNSDLLDEIYDQTEILRQEELALMQDLELCGERYKNLELICEGGMKYVYRCLDSHTDREVVMVKPKSEEINELFVREGRLNSFLQHPNIMPVYDVGLIKENEPFFTMKEVLGEDMNKVMTQDYLLANMIDIFVKICEGVNYAHSLGVVHLDLKPANIRIGNFGEVVICDWGIAELGQGVSTAHECFLDKDLSKVLKYIRKGTNENIKGTPGYIAPERFEKQSPQASNDIYALAAMLYEILSGQRPVQLRSTSERSLSCPDKLGANFLPHGLVAICNKGLSSQASQRYLSMSEMLEDLKRYVQGYATNAEKASLLRLLKLMYLRNKSFCLLLFSSLSCLAMLILYSVIQIEESRQLAVQEKESAVRARKQVERLNKNLQEKELARQELLKLESKRQLMIAYNSLAKKDFSEMNKAFSVARQFDPNSSGVLYFQGRLYIAERNWAEATSTFQKMKHEKAMSLVKVLQGLDILELLQHMDEIVSHLDYAFSEYLLLSLMKNEITLEERVQCYRWYLKVSHRGLAHLPNLKVNTYKTGKEVILRDELGIKNPGPLYLLKPLKVDLFNSGIIYPESLNICSSLEELSLQKTGVLGAGNLQMKNLKKLNISQTSSNDSYQFMGMPNLEELDISSTRIHNMLGFKELKKLKLLIIDASQETDIKRDLPKLQYKIKNIP